jgi:hypothetical protein
LNTNQQTTTAFYQNLGKLFYAIASADKCVRDEELHMLENVIKTEWIILKDFEDTSYPSDPITIVDTFKRLRNDTTNDADADFYFDSFVNFKRTHEDFFIKKVNSLILKIARKIATSFSDQNKSELILLAKLHLELKKSNS